MRRERYCDFETCPATGIRFDRQCAAEEPHAFADDVRTISRRGELGLRHPSPEREATAVVVNRQAAIAVQ